MELRNLLFNDLPVGLSFVTLSIYFNELPGGMLGIGEFLSIEEMEECKEFRQGVLHRCSLQKSMTEVKREIHLWVCAKGKSAVPFFVSLHVDKASCRRIMNARTVVLTVSRRRKSVFICLS